jgi:hypothetical protein
MCLIKSAFVGEKNFDEYISHVLMTGLYILRLTVKTNKGTGIYI